MNKNKNIINFLQRSAALREIFFNSNFSRHEFQGLYFSQITKLNFSRFALKMHIYTVNHELHQYSLKINENTWNLHACI